MDLDALTHPHGFCLAQFDPWLIMLSDFGNIATTTAYVVGFPFAMYRLFDYLPRTIMPVLALGIMFVVLCGFGHLMDTMNIHAASYLTYLATAWESVATGLVSWGFVLAVNWATRHVGLRIVSDGNSP